MTPPIARCSSEYGNHKAQLKPMQNWKPSPQTSEFTVVNDEVEDREGRRYPRCEQAPSNQLVFEMTLTCKDHHHPMLIGRIDHFLIAHRPTWLNHALDARFSCRINTIAEWEESVGGHH